MTFEKIRLEFTHEERAARITLASPKANVLDRAMIRELDEAVSQCASRALNAIVFAADGPHFSFGASVQEHLPDQIAGSLHALHALLRRIYEAPAPVIAAVRGQCLGGGFELALACDLIVANRTAQFASPEIKLGVFAPAASVLLPVRVGQAVASQLLLTGAAMTAEEAARSGLVAKVADDLDAALNQWLESDFLPRSPSSLQFACRASRLPLRRAFEEDLAKSEQLYLSGLMDTPDAVEGIRAFLEKRSPQWSRPAILAHMK
ncbi:MAG TPA: enoyl-CoA hydratase/isomerase family protein [Bryobacteraceae bacterium]|nr:enoyl-CoA hydratase/isomerase family protein [Bryobacteraceae bacterium]